MTVIVANPHGFCAGVNMAIQSLERALELFGKPIYVFHEIVHNKTIVERFQKRGVIFVDDVEEVPEGTTLLFSAHGVSPEIRKQTEKHNIKTIDATCPLVTKVHMEAKRFAKMGYMIFLIGHRGHDEIVGTMGEVPDSIRIIENIEDVQKCELPSQTKVAYLTQTTLSMNDAHAILEALKKKYPHIIGPKKKDICYATQNRQEAVQTLTPRSDLVLVLGSQNSSNSRRLAEIARSCGKPAHLIDHIDDIQKNWFKNVQNVLITAGASAPEDVVEECVEYLRTHFKADVESHTIREESMTFLPPKPLRTEKH